MSIRTLRRLTGIRSAGAVSAVAASTAPMLDKAVTSSTVCDLDIDVPNDGERWFRSFNGASLDVQYRVVAPSLHFRVVPADGSGHVAYAANTTVTLTGMLWRVARNGRLITLFEMPLPHG